jgi:hypothetical protein
VPSAQTGEVEHITAELIPAVPISSFGNFSDAAAVSRDQIGNTYVIDRASSALLKFGVAFDSLRSVSGYGSDHFQFDQPVDVDARQSNNIFVADYGNHRIEQYSKELAYLVTLYTHDDARPSARFGYPMGVALDDAGSLFFIDGENKRLLEANSSFQFDREIGSYARASSGDGVLNNPVGVAVDGYNNVIVLDNGGRTIVVFDNFGSPLKRISLTDPAIKITAWNDSLILLRQPDEKGTLKLAIYGSRTLEPRGVWELKQADYIAPVRDINVQRGTVEILSKHHAFVFTTKGIITPRE